MNTYQKYCPNVFVAKCEEQHEKGETIILTTRRGKENEHITHNFLGKTSDGFYLYSITRADGFNTQEHAKRKAEKLQGYASNAEARSNEAFKRADLSESATGIPFGQPILVGHHSERRHRKTIERADNAMRKSVEESRKAEEYQNRAQYWKAKENKIDLSMPESLEFFEFKLEEAKKAHQFLKDNPEKRAHSYSLTYAKKEVNELTKKVEIAVKLWGSPEEAEQIAKEKLEKAEAKEAKIKEKQDIVKKYGGFFAFSKKQLLEGYEKIKNAGHVEEGEKVRHLFAGLYMPVKNADAFLAEYKKK